MPKVNNNKTFSFPSTAVKIYRIQKSKYYDNHHCSTVVNEINRLDQPSPQEMVHKNVSRQLSPQETVHTEWVKEELFRIREAGNENLRFWSETILKSMREIFIIHHLLFLGGVLLDIFLKFSINWVFGFFLNASYFVTTRTGMV